MTVPNLQLFPNLDFSQLQSLKIRENTEWNYSYYPIVFEDEDTLLRVQKALNEEQIFPRRYFYPSLNTINYVENSSMPVSESIAARILCLPIYAELEQNIQDTIIEIIKDNL
mgnify:FL=1